MNKATVGLDYRRYAKGFCALLIVLALSFGVTVPQIEAADPHKQDLGTSRFTYIGILGANLDIDAWGLASCNGYVGLYSSQQTVNLTVILQKYSSGSWTDVYSWSDSGTAYPVELDVNGQRYVVSGSYRVRSTARVYIGGTLVESTTVYSDTVVY